ncbi:MAG: hypothetical protein HY265_03975, partial [Deltaproteobacteria bacterium]|nr:hypothetical protein [Deltaproteobacteria bacterium]
TKRPIPRFYSAPTFFEFTTAMAFLYFAEENVDIAVMEVGLGGRLDATNVCNPLVSIITNVAKDHEEMLGNRIRDIAFEKAGIIKNYGVLISAEAKPAVLKVLTAECKRKRTVFYRLNRDFFIDAKERGPGFKGSRVQGAMGSVSLDPWTPRPLFFKGRRWVLKDLKTNLLGKHQSQGCAGCVIRFALQEDLHLRKQDRVDWRCERCLFVCAIYDRCQ